MTALDLEAASRTLTIPGAPFTTIEFGDYTITASDAPRDVVVVDGFPGIPLDTDGALTTEAPTSALLGNRATFIAVLNTQGVIDGEGYAFLQSLFLMGVVITPSGIEADAGSQVIVYGEPFTASTGVTVFGVTNGTTRAAFASNLDRIIGTSEGITDTANGSALDLECNVEGVTLLGLWDFDDTEVDDETLLDTIDAIAALFVVPGVSVSAEGVGDFIGEVLGVDIITIGDDGEEVITPDDPVVIDPPTTGGTQEPPEIPPFVLPDQPLEDPYVWHHAENMPQPDLEDYWPVNWTPDDIVDEAIGSIQIVVEGVDITYLFGVKTPTPSWSDGEPYGYQSARIDLPQLTPFHPLPEWAKKNANVEIRMVFIGGGFQRLFVGVLFDTSVQGDDSTFGLDCIGIMFVADYQLRTPAFDDTPLDIGVGIPRLLNAVTGRRHATMAQVTTGIKMGVSGGWEPILTGFVQQILATALRKKRQWTIHCDNRTPVLEKKNTTTVAWEVRLGQRGVQVDLHSDTSDQTNVVFGEGTNSNGGHWNGSVYPNWHPDDTPPYPDDPSHTFTLGARDSNTDSGHGISDWERKAGVKVDGYLSSSDIATMKRLQKRAGITVDGRLGPQTWAATFNTGANTGSLKGAFIMPLAFAHEVMPRLFGPDGDDLGPNPDFDPNIIRIDRHINFGQGVSKHEGRLACEEIVARDSKDGVYGTITLTMDPVAKSRLLIRARENMMVRGWRDDDVKLHIASVDHDEDQSTLSVDSKARDYPTLDAILDRDREAQDPALEARRRLLQGQVAPDRPVYDAESPAGRLPRHAVFGGLWDVRKIAAGKYGRFAKTSIRTTNPATKFSTVVFGKPVQASDLVSLIGNPLTTGADESPYDVHRDALEDMGFLIAYGWAKQPLGYYPRAYSNPAGTAHDPPVTGRWYDDSAWEYASQYAPWLWVATITNASCYLEARFYEAA